MTLALSCEVSEKVEKMWNENVGHACRSGLLQLAGMTTLILLASTVPEYLDFFV